MKTLVTLLCLALCGCSSIPDRLSKYMPNGHANSVDVTAGTAVIGSMTIHATDVLKTKDEFTVGGLQATISNPYQPLVTLNIQGFTRSGQPVAPPAATSVARPSELLALAPLAPIQSPPFSSGNIMAPRIASSSTVSSNLNAAFIYMIEASNSPTVFSVTGLLPPGLVLEPRTGWIIGKATVAGVYPVQILAANIAGTASSPLTVTVRP